MRDSAWVYARVWEKPVRNERHKSRDEKEEKEKIEEESRLGRAKNKVRPPTSSPQTRGGFAPNSWEANYCGSPKSSFILFNRRSRYSTCIRIFASLPRFFPMRFLLLFPT